MNREYLDMIELISCYEEITIQDEIELENLIDGNFLWVYKDD